MEIGIDGLEDYWGFGLMALVGLITSSYRLYKAEKIVSQGIEVEGTVVEHEERMEADDTNTWDLLGDNKYYYAQVEYFINEEQSYIHTSSTRSKSKNPPVGEKMTIIYNSSDPSKSMNSSEESSMIMDYVVVVFSGLVIAYCIYMS